MFDVLLCIIRLVNDVDIVEVRCITFLPPNIILYNNTVCLRTNGIVQKHISTCKLTILIFNNVNVQDYQ